MGSFWYSPLTNSISVYEGGATDSCQYDKSNRVGGIYNKEFFRYDGSWFTQLCDPVLEGLSIRFRDGSGNWRYGKIHADDLGNPEVWPFNSVLDVGLGTISFDNRTLKVYEIKNRSEELYNSSADQIETLSVGTQIASDSDTMGSTLTWAWLIRAVKRNGVWQHADVSNSRYGFVDTGIRTGSMYNSISIKTSLG